MDENTTKANNGGVNHKRCGRFEIPGTWYKDGLFDLILQVQANCVITKAEYSLVHDALSFEAISADFAEVETGFEIPRYYATFSLKEGPDGTLTRVFTGWSPFRTDQGLIS